jgi:hypothetical protein
VTGLSRAGKLKMRWAWTSIAWNMVPQQTMPAIRRTRGQSSWVQARRGRRPCCHQANLGITGWFAAGPRGTYILEASEIFKAVDALHKQLEADGLAWHRPKPVPGAKLLLPADPRPSICAGSELDACLTRCGGGTRGERFIFRRSPDTTKESEPWRLPLSS